MKKLWMGALALTITAGAAMAFAPKDMACSEERGKLCEIRESTMPATGQLTVDASPNGGVVVRVWERNEVKVRAKVETWGESKETAASTMKQVTIEAANGRVSASGPRSDGWGRGSQRWSVSYEIYTPARTSLNARSVNGGVSVDGLQGAVDVQTTNGGVHVANVSGRVKGETVNGGISVAVSAGQSAESIVLKTTNGGVSLSLPENANAKVRARTMHGGMSSTFPGAHVQRGEWGAGPNVMELTLGNGAGTIELETVNGGVSVNKR